MLKQDRILSAVSAAVINIAVLHDTKTSTL